MAVNYVVSLFLFSVLLISSVNSREEEEEISDICLQGSDPGLCLGYFPRWYFNSTLNACTKFIYGGCQGNKNNFESKEECEKACLHRNHKELQSSLNGQEKTPHPDDKDLQSQTEEQENQEAPCRAALIQQLKKMSVKEKLLASILTHGLPMFRPKYTPTCDEEGYYSPMQCVKDKSECWCVDRLGNEIGNSKEKRTRGKPEELDCS